MEIELEKINEGNLESFQQFQQFARHWNFGVTSKVESKNKEGGGGISHNYC